MKYKFSIEKKSFDIEIANTATFHSPTEIRVNRTPVEIMVGECKENEACSFFLNNHLYQVEIVRNEEGYPSGIFINDEFYDSSLIRIDQLFYFKPKAVETKKSGTMRSFIPGYIKKIYFQAGDRVGENDIILIHEAMKMENEIRAPKSGVLKTLGVQEGENILANHLLFEIE